jgi:hypothetical protein
MEKDYSMQSWGMVVTRHLMLLREVLDRGQAFTTCELLIGTTLRTHMLQIAMGHSPEMFFQQISWTAKLKNSNGKELHEMIPGSTCQKRHNYVLFGQLDHVSACLPGACPLDCVQGNWMR